MSIAAAATAIVIAAFVTLTFAAHPTCDDSDPPPLTIGGVIKLFGC